MSIRIPVGAPVSVVYATGDAPVLARGVATRFDGDSLDIELAADVGIPEGARVIVELPPESGAPRAIVEVHARVGRALTGRLVRVQPADKREYPRLQGSISLRYRVAAGEQAAAAWMQGEPAGGAEHVPDPFMNFSATGLAFDDGPHAHDGDLLLCEFGLPGDTRTWRATARVVRVWPIPIDERDDDATVSHRIAIFFEAIPEEATAALTRYTIRIQDAILEGAR